MDYSSNATRWSALHPEWWIRPIGCVCVYCYLVRSRLARTRLLERVSLLNDRIWEINVSLQGFVPVDNVLWGRQYEEHDERVYDGRATELYITQPEFDPNDLTALKHELESFDEGRQSLIHAYIEQPRSEAYSEIFVSHPYIPIIEYCISVANMEPIFESYSKQKIRVFKPYIKHLVNRNWAELKRYYEGQA